MNKQLVGLSALAVLCIATIGLSCFVLVTLRTRDSARQHRNIHLIVDKTRVQYCPKVSFIQPHVLPCFKGPNEFISKRAGNLGPLRCKDDYFDEEGGQNFCESGRDTFHLISDGDAVVVQKPGVYRIYGQVAFKDQNSMPVVVLLRINEHSFVQCHQQNQPASPMASAPYTTCTLSGERRLREGDRVGLFLPDSRTVNVYGKTTFWGIVRMSD